MATTWPTAMDADDLSSGKTCQEITLSPLEMLWDRDRVVEENGTTLVAEISGQTATSWTTTETFAIWMPEWIDYPAVSTRTIKLTLRMETVGGATADFRLLDPVSAATGTEDTGNADQALAESVLDLGAWGGGNRTIGIQLRRTGGTSIGYTTERIMCNLRFGD